MAESYDLELLEHRLRERLQRVQREIQSIQDKINALKTVKETIKEEFDVKPQVELTEVKNQTIAPQDSKYADIPLAEACIQVIKSINKDWSVPEIKSELKYGGRKLDKNSYSSVFTTLTRKAKQGKIVEVDTPHGKRWRMKEE